MTAKTGINIVFPDHKVFVGMDRGDTAHSYRVGEIGGLLAQYCSVNGVYLPEERQAQIASGCSLHDIGKSDGPLREILKKGVLSPNERRRVRNYHVKRGLELATKLGLGDDVQEIVRGHHEKWNGTGYPCHFRGTSIPFPARIAAVADYLDSWVNNNFPRRLVEPKGRHILEEAFGEIGRLNWEFFDPAVVKSFYEMLRDPAKREMIESFLSDDIGIFNVDV